MSSVTPVRRVLVANRGEIAVRVMRTCHDLGIETVAVYSDPDRRAAHVLHADRAVALGGAAATDSYLSIDKLLAACAESGADAVHPGYGFLSENADFAEALAGAGIRLIGPPAAAMRTMGDKTRARRAVEVAGVPVVPGAAGPTGRGFPDAVSALAAAEALGFPVLLKASAGGGGKGMRLVEDPEALPAAFEGARREAAAAFGDDAVYLERAILRPRHVEIQIFADATGRVVHLGERDCSIQRRHQKVVEEAPSPALDAGLRAEMGTAAIRAARAADYLGAGTVEFLLGADGSFYFLEMNTRLQVEHPVTEMTHDVDLVAWQIAVCEGRPLPLDQEQIDARRRGAAIECRVYAEDPERFMPSPGTIERLQVPSGPYVRDDSGVYQGAEVSSHYDPMISKLITWGEDRDIALARMRRALREYVVRGIRTNLPFHRALLDHPAFRAGNYDTGFLGREGPLALPELAGEALAAGLAAAGISRTAGDEATREPPPVASMSRWRQRGWR
jgi:acetyl-CoA carboxylase biotin carboxylase subunit